MKHASLFTGIGGFDLAALYVGWENIFQVEVDNNCQIELRRLFPNVDKYLDAKEFTGTKYRGSVDVISMGFPCQNISLAASKNRDGVNGTKSILWREGLRIVDEVRPKFVVVENSSTIPKHGLDELLFAFAKIGYDAEWYPLQPRYFGIPQKRRERTYIIFYPAGFGDRLPEGKVFTGWNFIEYPTWRDTEPKIYGMADVIPNRVVKHRALGNAVAPVIPIEIFKAIELVNPYFVGK